MGREQRVMLLLGGNIGDSAEMEQRMEQAAKRLECEVGAIVDRSTMVQTAPWGFDEGASEGASESGEGVAMFTNQAIMLTTRLGAEELLDCTQRIERELGRDRAEEQRSKEQRGVRYVSRVIDIDIIFYGDEIVATPRLTTPHALMAEREFVLAPIVEIAPEWRHPQLGVTCRELLNKLKDR
ncbi:MAG: 2-amino-4-hydroxy-6-hydroxymethyldihydropteridine diphosphokinase [Rikenellaceae bacterium]